VADKVFVKQDPAPDLKLWLKGEETEVVCPTCKRLIHAIVVKHHCVRGGNPSMI